MIYAQDFENGTIPDGWSGDWGIYGSNTHSGNYCLKSYKISDGNSTKIEFPVEVLEGAQLSFYCRVSSETSYDKLTLYIDNLIANSWSGTVEWSQQTFNLTPGVHTIKFIYSKDGSGSRGEDAAYIDDVAVSNVRNIHVKQDFDTYRIVRGSVKLSLGFDALRTVKKTVAIPFDAKRKIEKYLSFNFDTRRPIGNYVSANFDTKRTTKAKYEFCADTKRIIAKKMQQSDIESVQITLSIDNFSDRPRIQSRKAEYLNYGTLSLNIGDFAQTITNPDTSIEITPTSSIYTLTGRPDMTEILYRDIKVEVDNLKLTTILKNLNMDYKIKEDFKITAEAINAVTVYNQNKQKYVYVISASNLKNLLSSLLDWSSSFYEKQLYYNYRNGRIFVTSREAIETYCYAEELPIDTLRIERTKIKNLTEAADSAGNENNTDYTPNQEEPEPTEHLLSGTMSFGDSSVTYANGLITREVNGDNTTTYNYTTIGSGGSGSYASVSNKYLRTKTVVGKDEEKHEIITETTYSYTDFAGEIVATDEVTKEYIKKGANTSRALRSIQTTNFVPIGNGYYGQTVIKEMYDEDQYSFIPISKEQTTAMSNGASSGQASLFTIKGVQGHKVSVIDPTPPVTIPGRPGTNLTCPIVETAIFKEYIELYVAMEGKIEETISASFYSNHIVDVCNTAFVYQSNTYYMSSNSVSKSANGIRQDIAAVRWY